MGKYFVNLMLCEYLRLKGLNYTQDNDPQPRKRSNSLPVPKIEVTSHDTTKDKTDIKEKLPNILESKAESTER